MLSHAYGKLSRRIFGLSGARSCLGSETGGFCSLQIMRHQSFQLGLCRASCISYTALRSRYGDLEKESELLGTQRLSEVYPRRWFIDDQNIQSLVPASAHTYLPFPILVPLTGYLATSANPHITLQAFGLIKKTAGGRVFLGMINKAKAVDVSIHSTLVTTISYASQVGSHHPHCSRGTSLSCPNQADRHGRGYKHIRPSRHSTRHHHLGRLARPLDSVVRSPMIILTSKWVTGVCTVLFF